MRHWFCGCRLPIRARGSNGSGTVHRHGAVSGRFCAQPTFEGSRSTTRTWRADAESQPDAEFRATLCARPRTLHPLIESHRHPSIELARARHRQPARLRLDGAGRCRNGAGRAHARADGAALRSLTVREIATPFTLTLFKRHAGPPLGRRRHRPGPSATSACCKPASVLARTPPAERTLCPHAPRIAPWL